MSHDPRDAECAERIVAAVIGLIRAVHEGQPKRIFGQIETLLTVIIERKAILAERPSDEALRRAIRRL